MAQEYTIHVQLGKAAKLGSFLTGFRVLTKTPLTGEERVWSEASLGRINSANQAVGVLEANQNEAWEDIAVEGYRKLLTDIFYGREFSQLPPLPVLNGVFAEILGLFRNIEPIRYPGSDGSSMPIWHAPALSPTKVAIITGLRALAQPHRMSSEELSEALKVPKNKVKERYGEGNMMLQAATFQGHFPRLKTLVNDYSKKPLWRLPM